ncbi:hypothetical protein R5W24_002558 [Gemmata sp. JC717]|uniref:Uncharacterized protein n=1 Tax=Gemmata algarum TaxID=2975278 RepID=A0ABU5F226_9BACT|nr:hypothetical protein [Gemmata algarum]MDY3553456.1 hypothetical protein [Gemmata algarum]MDY3561637.1 hypothetical protein [Gemmata algarum]
MAPVLLRTWSRDREPFAPGGLIEGIEMYSVVLMVAATSGGDMAAFGGKDKGGCHGEVISAGCTGSSCHGSSCHGGGFLGLRNGGGLFGKHKSGCHGSEYAGCTGCTGYTPAPAPVVVAAPAGCTGCTGYTPAGCHGSSCHGGGFLGLRDGGGLFGKKKGGCHGGCHGW